MFIVKLCLSQLSFIQNKNKALNTLEIKLDESTSQMKMDEKHHTWNKGNIDHGKG